jgi:small acid-soluble spore protein H (minor)
MEYSALCVNVLVIAHTTVEIRNKEQLIMDAKRAREIAASPKMVDVIYNGVPIYIESIMNEETAMVHTMGNPSNRQKASISELIEQ